MKTLLRYIPVVAAIAMSALLTPRAVAGPNHERSARSDANQQPDPKLPKAITTRISRSIENETITVLATLPDDVSGIKVSMYNILGKIIDIQIYGPTPQGDAQFQFQTKGLPNGPYLIVLEAGAQRITNKVMLSR